MRVRTLLAALTVALMAASSGFAQTKPKQCTPASTSKQAGDWMKVRHGLSGGKARCFESKCDIVWQEFKERGCNRKIIERQCQERNIQVVGDKIPC